MIIHKMSNFELVRNFEIFVRVEHYDPLATPPEYTKLRDAGLTLEMLRGEISRRLDKSKELTWP